MFHRPSHCPSSKSQGRAAHLWAIPLLLALAACATPPTEAAAPTAGTSGMQALEIRTVRESGSGEPIDVPQPEAVRATCRLHGEGVTQTW